MDPKAYFAQWQQAASCAAVAAEEKRLGRFAVLFLKILAKHGVKHGLTQFNY